MKAIEALLHDLKKSPAARLYPGSEATEAAVAAWEKREEVRLPADYRYYLTRVGKCKLHGAPELEHSFAVKLFPLRDVGKYAVVSGIDWVEGVDSWYAIADAQDGNYIVMDLDTADGDQVDIIDGFHEIVPEVAVISKSFTEFLERSLADPDTSSGGGDMERGTRYWSTPGGYYEEANERAKRLK